MVALVYSLIGAIIVSLLSLIGISTFLLKKRKLQDLTRIFVAFAAGTLLAVAALDLLPEATEGIGESVFQWLLAGILLFFFIERFIHWHHHQDRKCKGCAPHPVVFLNVLGDAVHNFIDGAIIAAAFMTNTAAGIATTIAIAAHEIPQEMSDFVILIHGGLTRAKALFYNFLSAICAILGVILTFIFATEKAIPILLAISAGGFLYISTTDIFPMMHREVKTNVLVKQLIALILGIVGIWIILTLLHS